MNQSVTQSAAKCVAQSDAMTVKCVCWLCVLVRYVQGDTFWDNMKKLVMGIGFAMKATERNPNFLDDLLKVSQFGVGNLYAGTYVVGKGMYKTQCGLPVLGVGWLSSCFLVTSSL